MWRQLEDKLAVVVEQQPNKGGTGTAAHRAAVKAAVDPP